MASKKGSLGAFLKRFPIFPQGKGVVFNADSIEDVDASGFGLESTTWVQDSARRLNEFRSRLPKNSVCIPSSDFFANNLENFSWAFIRINKMTENNLWLFSQVWNLVQTEGEIYFWGAKNEGIVALQRRLERQGLPVETVQLGAGSRLLRVSKEAAYCPEQVENYCQKLCIYGQEYFLESIPGTYSADRLDLGSELLIQNLPSLQGKSVLDLGCGAGVLSLAAVAKGAESICAADDSFIAVESFRSTLERLGIKATTWHSDMNKSIGEKFDVIITNPPFHEGKQTKMDLGVKWAQACKECLKPGGTVYLVANSFLKYPRFLQENFGEYSIMEKTTKFCLYKAVL